MYSFQVSTYCRSCVSRDLTLDPPKKTFLAPLLLINLQGKQKFWPWG